MIHPCVALPSRGIGQCGDLGDRTLVALKHLVVLPIDDVTGGPFFRQLKLTVGCLIVQL